MPAEVGIQWCGTWMWSSCKDLDSGVRRNDGQQLTYGKSGRTTITKS